MAQRTVRAFSAQWLFLAQLQIGSIGSQRARCCAGACRAQRYSCAIDAWHFFNHGPAQSTFGRLRRWHLALPETAAMLVAPPQPLSPDEVHHDGYPIPDEAQSDPRVRA
jgi:hypothetical protein